jgi:DNA-directed RNA polymerase subunit RPC12/RpoP
MKYWLKTCPRCSGDLREESDSFGSYISCVQCGYVLTSAQEAAILATGMLEPVARVEEPQHLNKHSARRMAA